MLVFPTTGSSMVSFRTNKTYTVNYIDEVLANLRYNQELLVRSKILIFQLRSHKGVIFPGNKLGRSLCVVVTWAVIDYACVFDRVL